MARKQNKIQEDSKLQEETVSISSLSIPELARKIENKTFDPNMFDKAVLAKVAMYYKIRRGYKPEDIAEILQVCTRTVERYIENVRSDNSLKIGANFQNELLGEVLSDFRLQYQRLWRLSYSDNLSDYEKARIIFMCSQIRLNEVMLLSRLGYLSSARGAETIEDVKKEIKELEKRTGELVDKRLGSLTSWQFKSILDVCRANSAKLEVVLEKMVNDYEVENERQRTLTGHVDDFKELRCRVFVINGLRN